MSDWFQWVIVTFIILSILWHVFKGGAANPESTGAIGEKVNVLGERVSTLSTRVGQVETNMKQIEQTAATTKDIEKLEELIDAKLDGQRALSQATNEGVRRIERIILEKGLGRE